MENSRPYQIALSPDLHITAEEFAEALNDDPEAREKNAEVLLTPGGGAKFLDPLIVGALLSIPATVASSEIYDLLKNVIHRIWEKKGHAQPQSPRRHIHIEQTKKPDGTEILVIDMDE